MKPTGATKEAGIERELEAVNVVDGLLVLMRESPGWDFNAVDHAFNYLRRMRRAYPHLPLTVSVNNELGRRVRNEAHAALNDAAGVRGGDECQ